jgi:hypothetical protein
VTIGQFIALAVALLLAVFIVIGHATLTIVGWSVVALAVAVLLGGVAVRVPSA